jgi:uncharacterized protein
MPRWLCLIFIPLLSGVVTAASAASAAEVIPPAPTAYVNDYAGVMNNTSALNAELEQFERDTSNQIVVAIYPKMQSDSSVDDYTVRVANSWKVGNKKLNNGAILFVFAQDHKMFIQTGYGMEGALPDATCKTIIEQEITPRFRNNDFQGGVTAGVHAMMAATRGEYKGSGQTVNDRNGGGGGGGGGVLVFLAIIGILILISFFRRATTYGNSGRGGGFYMGSDFWMGWLLSALMNSGRNDRGGGGFGGFGGGGGGGGGGGFSSGGGSFGGGGAGGSW